MIQKRSRARRRRTRLGMSFAVALLPCACLVPEYSIIDDDDGSGGGASDEATGGSSDDGSGGSSDDGSGGVVQSSAGGSGGNAAGGQESGGGGMGGDAQPWSCAEESSNLPVYYSNAELCGYRFTLTAPASGAILPTITPACAASSDADCFEPGFEFATGHVPPSNLTTSFFPMIGIGMHVSQPSSGGSPGVWEVAGWGVVVDYTLKGAARPARIQARIDDTIYCATAMSGAPLAWSDFRIECWNPVNTLGLETGDFIDGLDVTVHSVGDIEQDVTELDLDAITMLGSAPNPDPVCPDGCAQLYVPLSGADASQGSEFVLDLGDDHDFSDPADRIVTRVYVETDGDTGGLQFFVRDAGGGVVYLWSKLGEISGFYELGIEPASVTKPGFDATAVRTVGFQIGSGEPLGGETLGDTTVYVESVRFEGASPLLDEITFPSSTDPIPALDTAGTYILGSTSNWVQF